MLRQGRGEILRVEISGVEICGDCGDHFVARPFRGADLLRLQDCATGLCELIEKPCGLKA